MSRIEEVLSRVHAAALRAGRRPEDITVVAISKGQPATAIREAVANGIRHVGENYVQEAAPKIEACRDLDVTWHFTGHLQRNKAAQALQLFGYIQTVDSVGLLQRLDRLAERPVPVLFEVHLGDEPTKSGLQPEHVAEAVAAARAMQHVRLEGLMTIPPAGDPRRWFRQLRELSHRTAAGPVLSMGMSDDFEVAIEEGATHVRIGRALFGER